MLQSFAATVATSMVASGMSIAIILPCPDMLCPVAYYSPTDSSIRYWAASVGFSNDHQM